MKLTGWPTGAAAAMLLTGLILGGCANVHKGMSTDAAEAQLRHMEGVDSASVSYSSIEQSTSSDAVLNVNVKLKDGVAVPDPGRLAEYVARVGWSSGGRKPSGGMAVSIVSSPQLEFGAAIEEEGWKGVVYDDSDRQSLNIGYHRLVDKLGEWPAQPPKVKSSIP